MLYNADKKAHRVLIQRLGRAAIIYGQGFATNPTKALAQYDYIKNDYILMKLGFWETRHFVGFYQQYDFS